MAAITDKQNVFFKHGTQTKYDGLSNRDSGTFYVTTDTHRLYLGDNLLSQAVQTVANVASLPAASDARREKGQIYYAEAENVLAVYDTAKQGWVQLNPDTRLEDMTLETSTADGTTQLSLIIKENRSTGNNGSDNSFAQNITFSGAKGIAVAADEEGHGLVITAPELTVGTATGGAKIGLDTKEVPIVGDGSTTVSYDSANGKIKISSSYENTVVTGGAVIAETAEDKGFDVTVQLEVKKNGKPEEAIVLTKGNFNPVIQVATNKGADGLSYDGLGAKFEGGIAKVDTYSTSYLDKKFQDTLNQVNAMTYKGKLAITGGIATLPTSGVSVGDTYILPEAAQVTGSGTNQVYQPGTLFIAKGTEGENGIIGSDLSFDSVLTSDSDTTYRLVNDTANVLSFYASTKTAEPQSMIEIADDGYIEATITSKADNNAHATITVNHKDLGFEETKDASLAVTQDKALPKTFTVVDSIEQNKGHITKVVTKDITVVDTVTKLSEADFGVSVKNGVATIDLAVTDTEEGSVASKFNLASNTLTLAADADTATVRAELVWGSFDD